MTSFVGRTVGLLWNISHSLPSLDRIDIIPYRGTDITNGSQVMLKLARPEERAERSLENEHTILHLLHFEMIRTPRPIRLLLLSDQLALITSLPGQDLKYHCTRHGNLTTSQVKLIGVQILAILRELHRKNVRHGHLHPGNITFTGDLTTNHAIIYLNNFSTARIFRDSSGRLLNSNINTEDMGESITFCSVNMQDSESRVISVRDDLESLGYLLVYLRTGTLPWFETASKYKMYGGGFEQGWTSYLVSQSKERLLEHDRGLLCCGFSEMKPYFDMVQNLDLLQEVQDYTSFENVLRTIAEKVMNFRQIFTVV